MAALLDVVKKGVTDRSVTLRIIDDADGTPELAVVFNSAGIDLWYRREGAAKVSITEATLAALTTAHADGGFLHIGDGEYRLDLPDAAFATGANHVDVGGAVTDMIVVGGRVRLVDYDLEDTVRLGLTALPAAAAEAAGGLYTRGTGAGQINQNANGQVDTRTVSMLDAVITSAKFAANALDAVWSTAARLLTAGTNIVLAKGTGVTGLNDLDAAGVRAAVGLGAADLDTQLGDLPTNAELATALAAADDAVIAAVAALNNLDAAGVRTALGMTAADLDTQLAALPTNAELATALAAADDAVIAAVAALSIPTADANADALLDRVGGVETGYTVRQAMRIILAALAGKLSGAAGTTVSIRDVGDTKDRVVALVDADGNRTAVTLDGT